MITREQALIAATEAGSRDDQAALSRLIIECEFRISPAALKSRFKIGQLNAALASTDRGSKNDAS